MSRAPDPGARGYLGALLPWRHGGDRRDWSTRALQGLPGPACRPVSFCAPITWSGEAPLVVVGAGRPGGARLWWELCLISHAGQRCGLSRVQRRSRPPCSRSRTWRTPAAYRNPLSRSWFRGRGPRRVGCTPGSRLRPRCRSPRSSGRGRPTGMAERVRPGRSVGEVEPQGAGWECGNSTTPPLAISSRDSRSAS